MMDNAIVLRWYKDVPLGKRKRSCRRQISLRTTSQ